MPTLAAYMLSFENEPTAVLHELRASGMALPLLDSPHVMQLRTPVDAKLRSRMLGAGGRFLASGFVGRIVVTQWCRPTRESASSAWLRIVQLFGG